MPLENRGHLHHVGETRSWCSCRCTPDRPLMPARAADGADVVRAVGAGGQRHQGGQIDGDGLVILSRRRRRQAATSPPRGPAPQRTDAGHLVAGEDRGGGAQLGAHVGDGGALGHRQGLHARPGVLHRRLPTPPLTLRRRSTSRMTSLADTMGGSWPVQLRRGTTLGMSDIVGAAAHGHRHVQPAGADGQHADAAAGGGVAVGAQQGLARAWRSAPGAPDGRCRCPDGKTRCRAFWSRCCDVFVVVGVFKAGLQHVVVDVGHRTLGFDLRPMPMASNCR